MTLIATHSLLNCTGGATDTSTVLCIAICTTKFKIMFMCCTMTSIDQEVTAYSCQGCLDLFDPIEKTVKSKGQSRKVMGVKVMLNGYDDIM